MISEIELLDVKKRKLEAKYTPKISYQLDQIASISSKLYSINGQLNAKEISENFKIDFISLFRFIYRDTINSFVDSLRKKIRENEIAKITSEENTKIQEEIDNESIFYINNNSEKQAQIVTETTEKDINKAVVFAIGVVNSKINDNRIKIDNLRNQISNINNNISTRTGNVVELITSKKKKEKELNKLQNETIQLEQQPKKAISSEINKKIKKDNIARSSLIAEQEIGNSESYIRHKEAVAVYNSNIQIEGVAIGQKMKKKWDATLDNRTRPAHANADGQVVDINDSFIVGGEYLKYPRDPSASFENISRCRCEEIIVFV